MSTPYAKLIKFIFLTFKLMWRVNEPKHLLVNLILNWMVVAILLPFGAIFQKKAAPPAAASEKTLEKEIKVKTKKSAKD